MKRRNNKVVAFDCCEHCGQRGYNTLGCVCSQLAAAINSFLLELKLGGDPHKECNYFFEEEDF